MPSLRLSVEDSRDVASYLITLKHPDAHFDAADFMDDAQLKAKGKTLVQFYGCAGCHEIAGMEDEGRIGTELTNEGSKPIERLDFALLTEDAKQGHPQPDGSKGRVWYDLKGFFENKLTNPAVYDTGKYKPNPQDRLRMPKPNVTADDIDALTTMLLGSTDPTLPPDYMYKPVGRARLHSAGLVDRHEIQLHGLPPDRYRPAIGPDGSAHVSGPGQDRPPAGPDQ